MKYYIFTLKFDSGYRFSANKGVRSLNTTSNYMGSDALFSAIVSEGVSLYGNNFADELFEATNNDNLILSDLLPCIQEDDNAEVELFIPKPSFNIERESDNIHSDNDSEEDRIKNRKKLKKLEFVSILKLEKYIEYLKNPSSKKLDKIMSEGLDIKTQVDTKNAITIDENGDRNTLPFQVSVNRAKAEIHYYFVIACEENRIEQIENVLKSLQYTGLGGKKSVGYGKFELSDDICELDLENTDLNIYSSYCAISKMLSLSKSFSNYIAISSVLPDIDDFITVKGSSNYSLSKRGGFVYSENYFHTPVKKKMVVMIDSGSTFPKRIKSKIIDVSDDGNHPVYRMGKAMLLGVDI